MDAHDATDKWPQPHHPRGAPGKRGLSARSPRLSVQKAAQERHMSDHKPNEPKLSDFQETMNRSDNSGGDESASFVAAEQPTEGGDAEKDSQAHPS